MKDMFPKCKDVKNTSMPFNQLLPKYDINKEQWQFWFAQYGTETQGFTRLVENTNYTTPELLMKVFKYFPLFLLLKCMLENLLTLPTRVYAGRYGNGDENSGMAINTEGEGVAI